MLADAGRLAYSGNIATSERNAVKPANFPTLLDDIREAFASIFHTFGRAAKHIATLPWPALLVCALLFAFAITVIPLALFVFVILLAIKFAVTAIVVDRQRSRRD